MRYLHNLKKLEISVNEERSNKLEEFLENENISYLKYSSASKGKSIIIYTLNLDDPLLDRYLDEITGIIDLRLKDEKIIIQPIEAYVSTELDRISNKSESKKTPIEALLEQVEPYSRLNRDFFMIVMLATLILVSGLFMDNIIVIIGATLISPLLEPIKAFSLNLVIAEYEDAWESEQDILILLFFIFVLSFIITYGVSVFYPLSITEQIFLNGSASGIIALVSFLIGVSSGLAMFANIPGSLMGIAVAVALMPPASSAGIGLAVSNMNIFYGGVFNLISNFAGLQLGGVFSLKIKGVSHRKYKDKGKKEWPMYLVILVHVIILFLILIRDFYA